MASSFLVTKLELRDGSGDRAPLLGHGGTFQTFGLSGSLFYSVIFFDDFLAVDFCMNLPGWLLSVPCFQRLIIRFKDDPRLPGTKFPFSKCGRSKSTMSTAVPTQRPS